MKKLIAMMAFAGISCGAEAGIRYDYMDASQRVEVVPSQGSGTTGTGFWYKIVEVQRSVVEWLELQRGLLLIFK